MKWLSTKYAGFCWKCRSEIFAGEKALWRNHHLFCTPCGTALMRRSVMAEEARRDAAAAARSAPDAEA